MTLGEFGQRVKQKYPEYNDISDEELGKKVLLKYPEYNDMVDSGETKGAAKFFRPFMRGFEKELVPFSEKTGQKIIPGEYEQRGGEEGLVSKLGYGAGFVAGSFPSLALTGGAAKVVTKAPKVAKFIQTLAKGGKVSKFAAKHAPSATQFGLLGALQETEEKPFSLEGLTERVKTTGEYAATGVAFDAILAPIFGKAWRKLFPTKKARQEAVEAVQAGTQPKPQVGTTPVTTDVPLGGIPEAKVKQEVLSTGASKQINEAFVKFAKATPDDPLLLTDRQILKTNKLVAQGLRLGKFDISKLSPDLQAGLKKNGWSEKELADWFEYSATYSGRTMNFLSRVEKELKKLYPKDIRLPDEGPPSIFDQIRVFGVSLSDIPRRTLNTWRASLVGQAATAARNLITATARTELNIFEEALADALRKVTGKEVPYSISRAFIEEQMAFLKALSPAGRKRIAQILEAYPLEASRLVRTPISDVLYGQKTARLMSYFNTTQEVLMRKSILGAKVARGLIEQRLNPLTTVASDIPEQVIKDAVDSALKFTFAQNPTGKTARWFVNFMNNTFFGNLVEALVYPFPRYLTNALNTIYELTPIGITRFVHPKYWNKYLWESVSKTGLALPERATQREFYRVSAQTAIGAMGFFSALWLRNSKYAGEKWYEIKAGNKTLDMRPFGPLFPTYLFMADAMKRSFEGTFEQYYDPKDFAEGMLGINRIAGTTLFLTTTLPDMNFKSAGQAFAQFAGTFLGGFTKPFATFDDLVGQFSKEERFERYTKEHPIIGPPLANIPFAERLLPPSPKITRAEPEEKVQPLLRQVSGIIAREKTPIEEEIDRLGIKYKNLVPRTGEPKFDRLITEKAGLVVSHFAQPLLSSEEYQTASDYDKEKLLKELVSEAKSEAKEYITQQYAEEIADIILSEWGNTPDKRQRYLDKISNKGLLTDPVLEVLKERLGL